MIAAGSVASLGGSACSGKVLPAGGAMIALSSDMSIPKDVDVIEVSITQNGISLFQRDYPVGPNPAETIPATLLVLPPAGDPTTPVQVRVVALLAGQPQILRDAILVVPTDRIVELRMPVEWLCEGSAGNGPPTATGAKTYVPTMCATMGQTCAAGACAPATVNVSALPTYAPGDVFGGGSTDGGDGVSGGSCFDTVGCFDHASVAAVNAATCTIAPPSGGSGTNVAILLKEGGAGICGSEACLVPLDSASKDGWQATGGSIQLPPAVCSKIASGAAEGVVTTTACGTKTSSEPPCGAWSSVSGPLSDAGQSINFGSSEDAASESGTANTPPSCQRSGVGLSDCPAGDGGTESCCTSPEVAGGSFDRSYDGVTSSGYDNASYAASVSSLRLDRFEVTVGRFRQFVSAVEEGWQPTAGSGKHTHLNQGNGLVVAGTTGVYESGWDASWNQSLATGASAATTWSTNLSSCGTGSTWSASPGSGDDAPINCLTWAEAYAFCIWDGGFLPSESEWNYAAAGGGATDGQRVYPWSTVASSQTIDCSHANYLGAEGSACVPAGVTSVGAESPVGDGKWGQADLAGNVAEWSLDWYASYVTPCPDCAYLTATSERVVRGGSFTDTATSLLASARDEAAAAAPLPQVQRALPAGMHQRGDGRYVQQLCPPGVAKNRCFASRVMPEGYQPFTAPAPDMSPPANSLSPANVLAAYGIPATAQANGKIVAVLDLPDSNAYADLTAYRSQFGLAALPKCAGLPDGSTPCFAQVSETGGTSSGQDSGEGGDGETALDIEMISAACPDCAILLVEVGNATTGVVATSDFITGTQTAASLGAQATSISWGGPEGTDPTQDGGGAADPTGYTTPGHLVLAASGDFGYDEVDAPAASPAYPASSPDVLAVGGTNLILSGSKYAEAVWSDGTFASTDQGQDVTTSGCSTEFAMPTWQSTALSGTTCARRATVDLSAAATFTSSGTEGAIAVFSSLSSGWIAAEGTSASSPMVAAILVRLGLATTISNNLAWPYENATSFNDLGSAAYPSAKATTNASTTGCGKLCTVGTGWDGPSGVGTPNGAALSGEADDGGVDSATDSGSKVPDSGTTEGKDSGSGSMDSGSTSSADSGSGSFDAGSPTSDAGGPSSSDDGGTVAAGGARSVSYGVRCARIP